MIILFPLDNFDGFITEADCTTFLNLNVPASQLTAYLALDTASREILIRQSTTLIKNKITLPATLEDNLSQACAYLVNYSVGINMTLDDGNGNIKIDEVVGAVKTEFFSPNDANNSFPDIVELLLSDYGLAQDGTWAFKQGM